MPIPSQKFLTSTPTLQQHLNAQLPHYGNVIIQPIIRPNNNHMMMHASRSSQSTPSPSTTTANVTAETSAENIHLNPIVKMEVPDDDDDCSQSVACAEQKSCENGNFNYVGEFIAAELNKLPLRDAFMLKNILIREVLTFSEKLMLVREKQ